ncbi:hypothetical protein SAMN05661044_05103 [Olivibacter domesticus]|uniref:Uncharacterized protein n=1 Tax=Olivibacter domesticus TaxID=407022 RepID=A0A1H7Y5A3_OLID1|nr:hypothetical protein SAMN05661044_05103 [Olivibacter domesticus]
MNYQKVKIKKTTIFKFKQLKIKNSLPVQGVSSTDAIIYQPKQEST